MSTRSAFPRARTKVLLLVAVCAVTAALLAAPGVAGAANATGIVANSQSSTVTWGQQTVLTGILMDTDTMTALGGQWLLVERSATGAPGSWTLVAAVTTEGEAQYSTGQYTQVVQPQKLTYYRFVFEGTPAYAPSISNTVVVKVRPFLGKPVPPTSVKAGKKFTVSGALKPRFKAGAKTVKVKIYRAKGSKWVFVKRLSATNADSGQYSKYVLKTSLKTKGKYRFRAYTTAMPGWAPAVSTMSRTLVVK